MAISQAYVGSATISTTEYSLTSASTTLSSVAVSGIYQLFLDLSTLTATEGYRLRIKEKVQSSSTQRVIQDVMIYGAQTEPIYVTPSLLLMNGWDITLLKVEGTARSIEYSIRKVA